MIRSHRLLIAFAFTFTFILIPSLFIICRERSANYNYQKGIDAGLGRAKDYKTAAKYYTLAAEKGHSQAQYFLGELYEDGKGVEKDLKEAFKW